jgi:hypothetical protein
MNNKTTKNENALVPWTHDCFDSADFHHRKYKHWAKIVKSVDTTQTNGYAFQGDFLAVRRERKLPVGSIVVEVCEEEVRAYRLTQEGKRLLAECRRNGMSALITTVAEAVMGGYKQ